MPENVCKSLVYTNDLFYCGGNESIKKKKQFKTALKVIYDLCLHWLLVFYVTTCT